MSKLDTLPEAGGHVWGVVSRPLFGILQNECQLLKLSNHFLSSVIFNEAAHRFQEFLNRAFMVCGAQVNNPPEKPADHGEDSYMVL